MASSTSNSREREFLYWIRELNAELRQSSRTDDHGTIKKVMAPNPAGRKRAKSTAGKAKKRVENEDEPCPQPPLIHRQALNDEVSKMVANEGEPCPQPLLFHEQALNDEVSKMVAKEGEPCPQPLLFHQKALNDEVSEMAANEGEPYPQLQLFHQPDQKRQGHKLKKMLEIVDEPHPQPQFSHQLDQKRWADKVKKMVENELNPQQKDVGVCILHVPKRLIEFKPKSYTPQLLGLGPYHHLKPDLQELERFKVAVIAKYLKNHSSHSLKFEGIVRELAEFEPTICSCYHKYLDLDGDTLATIIAVDGLFLLEFVQGVAGGGARIDEMSDFVFAARKVTEADVIGDVMMLQNQFPLVLLKLLVCQPEEGGGNDELKKAYRIWSSFCELVSPFDTTCPPGELDGFFDHSMHFLDALYQQISRNDVVSDHHKGEREASSNDGRNNNQQPERPTIEQWSGLLDLMGKVLEEVAKFVGNIPILIKSAIEIVTRTCRSGEKKPDEENPVVEITIPSVTQLAHQAKVGFMPTQRGIRDIRFDGEGLVLYLPVLKVNANTEIVLRNLVAFEAASQYSDAPILEEYTELMCGIVDSPEDVALLKSRKIISSELSNDDVARLFNSMSKYGDRPRTESNIDKTIVGVNEYYNGISKMKTKNRMMQWAYASWKGLTVFCTILLLSLTFVESFCQVYGCSSRFFKA